MRRESIQTWPLFREDSRHDVDVLSIIGRRKVTESISAVSAAIAATVGAALQQTGTVTQSLLFLSHEMSITGKVDALLQDRNKLWRSLELQDIAVPAGSRKEWNVSTQAGSNQYFGVLGFEIENLIPALEITRTNNAICVASRESRPMLEAWSEALVPSALDRGRHQQGRASLFRGTVSTLPRDTVVMRAYGEFDDVEIAVDILGVRALIDELEAAVPLDDSPGA